MTHFSYIRAGLLSAALLLTTAIASPAFAENLPEISPRQIASDVERVQNPNTGAYEYIAPSFDPFEQDRSMAGSVGLRSVSAGTTIDGHSIRGGALLDMSFYYNSSSNDPYDTRGFEEAVFLSGDYAPVTLRDNRILECNEHVQDVVYYHEDYYRPSLYVNLYRPYRYYSGHYLYDGFRGSRGYNYGRSFIGGRGFGTSSFIRNRIRNTSRNRRSDSRDGFTDRAADRIRRSNREDGTERRRRADRDRTRTRTRDGAASTTRRLQTNDTARANRREIRRNGRATRAENPQTRNLDSATRQAPRTRGAATPRPNVAGRTATQPRPVRSDANAAARAQRAESISRAAEKSKNAPKRNSGSKGRSQTRTKNSQSKNRSQTRSKNRTPARSQNRSLGRSKLKLINLLPMASAFSRNVVRNVDVQCAREELLSVHISQERLDAARFDGLTVLVLDRAGDEIPVYVPPNYIEGFRRAASGNVAPNVSYQEPRSSAPVTRGPVDRGPVYQAPPSRSAIEPAACPAGTAKQADGTCLQGGTTTYGGYPAR